MAQVIFNAVSKSYSAYARPSDRLRELLWPGRRRHRAEFWALRDVTFQAGPGDVLCLIGENGSGKSTSLQLAAGILRPTSGSVQVDGRVSALLELGAGFHPEFTGRENARLSAAMHGLSKSEIDRRFPQIEEFADIGDFIDKPVMTYSTGMVVRLAFAVAISVEPEILLVDEALAVGDFYFRQRCMRRVHELRRGGVTIVFVTHSMADVQALGSHVVWLDGGRVAGQGAPRDMVRKYLAVMHARDRAVRATAKGKAAASSEPAPEAASHQRPGIPNVEGRFGTGRAHVTGMAVLDDRGRPLRKLFANQGTVVRIMVQARDDIAAPIVGFMMRNHLGIDFAGSNTSREGYAMEPMRAGERRTVDFCIQMPELYPGSFSFAPAISDGSLIDYEICDWIDNAVAVPMARGTAEIYGYIHLPCQVHVSGPEGVTPHDEPEAR